MANHHSRRRLAGRLSTTALALFGIVIASMANAGFTLFESAGADATSIIPTRDAFRAAVGGGDVAGANGSFGGLRREINWDGVPAALSDPNLMPADFFNTTSPRGAEFSTPGTGFMVSANAGGASPTLFGLPSDFQTFSPQKLFTAINSNITDVTFFTPGTDNAATTSAFGVIFVDAEIAGLTSFQFFDASNNLILSRNALITGNQGFSFLGAVANAGERISRVRITSGLNTIASNGVLGNPNDDVVVMDDFLFAEPLAIGAVPEPASLALMMAGVLGLGIGRRRRGYELNDAETLLLEFTPAVHAFVLTFATGLNGLCEANRSLASFLVDSGNCATRLDNGSR